MIMFYHVRQRKKWTYYKKMISMPEKLISMERIFRRIKTVGRSLGLIVPALIVNKAHVWWGCAGLVFVNLTQTGVTWEEGPSLGEPLPSDGPAGEVGEG